MIFEHIFGGFFDFFSNSLINIPFESSISFDVSFSWIKTLFSYASYFLPMKSLMVLVIISISLDLFRLSFAFIIRIKSFIPFMGA